MERGLTMSDTAESAYAAQGSGVGEIWLALRRRWWLVVGLPLVVAGFSLAFSEPPPTQLQAQLSFAVDIPASALVAGSDEGTAAKIGEALIDDFSRIVAGDVFAEAVEERLPTAMSIGAGEVASSLSATDRHRIADVTVTRSIAAGASEAQAQASQELKAIAEAVVAELEENSGSWFERLGDEEAAVTVIARPTVVVLPPSLRHRLDLPLRLLLAFLLGAALALLLHVVDKRLYSPDEARQFAGAPVVGLIPRRGRFRLGVKTQP
jgi:capsular polysaccharide biosynthesis protein